MTPPINIAFGEPSLMLGLLLTVAGAVIIKRSGVSVGLVLATASGAAWVVFCVGLVLAAITSAIFSYNLVGDAPPQEPITGQFTGWENTFFGLIYALAALGCLFAPGVRIGQWYWINRLVIYSWTLSGAAFLIFSVLNYRTHIGLLINIERGTDYRW